MAPATRALTNSRENVLGDLIADGQLAATQDAARGGAQLALMNPGGIRTDLLPAANGEITYGQLFAAQPFGNVLVVKTFTGAQIRAVLEQQFESGSNTLASPRVLLPSRSFTYSYDLAQPLGARIHNMALNGRPMSEAARYRVVTNSFLAAGGDNFSVLVDGTDAIGGILEVDALEDYLKTHNPLVLPVPGRIRKIGR
jgi:5'-nucleotidase